MNHSKSELYFLLAFLTGIFVLAFFIFKPFLFALILAAVFGTIFEPLHQKAFSFTRQKASLAAFLTTLSILIIVVVPIAFLGVQIFHQASDLYSSLATNSGTASDLSQLLKDTIEKANQTFSLSLDSSVDLSQYLEQGLDWLIQNLGLLFSNIIKIIVSLFIFLIALYYVFKDGHKLKRAFIILSPLQDVHDEVIFKKLSLAVNSVIKGSLVVALVQGVLTGIGFAIFTIPHAVLWGSVASIAALIPGVGTALVFLPAVLFLFFTGNTFLAVSLMLWGGLAVGLVDNFLGPKLAERGMQLHPFLILLSILGGIAYFGPLGFLLGPLTLSLLAALLEVYFVVIREHKKNFSA